MLFNGFYVRWVLYTVAGENDAHKFFHGAKDFIGVTVDMNEFSLWVEIKYCFDSGGMSGVFEEELFSVAVEGEFL